MIRPSFEDIARLIRRADGDNAFAILDHCEAGNPESPKSLEAVGMALAEIVEGRDDRFRDGVRRLLEARREPQPIDRITAKLMAHALCDPASVCAIARMMVGIALMIDEATDEEMARVDDTAMVGSPFCENRVWVAPGIHWGTRGALQIDMPDIMASAVIGMKLRRVVAHPVLDQYDLTITGYQDAVLSHEAGRLTVDASTTAITVDDLMAIRPPRD